MSNAKTFPLASTARRWACPLAIALALPAAGQSATLLGDGYTMRVWQTDDGLPQNAVNAVRQTRDGYIWIGTFGGLARFDGERFEVFDSANTPALPDSRIVSLYEDRDGTLWIGHETGTVTRYRAGKFERVPSRPDADRQNVRAIAGDEAGQIWIMYDDGVLESPSSAARLPTLIKRYDPAVLACSQNARGEIWIDENGVVAQVRHGRLDVLPLDFPNEVNFALGVAASARGGAWVSTISRVRRWDGQAWAEDRGASPWGNGFVSCCLELHDGTLAVGTVDHGLYLVPAEGKPIHLDQASGMPQHWIRCLYEDREDNLWMGVGSAGLVAIRRSAFTAIAPPDGWQGRTVLTVAAGRNGSVWAGTEGAGVYRYADHRWKRFGPDDGISNPFIWSVREENDGVAWVGCWRGGPFRLDGQAFVADPDPVATTSPILSMLRDPETHEMLVGTRDGLLAIHDGESKWLYRPADGAAANVGALLRDRDSVVWFGMAKGGLGRLSHGDVSLLGRREGLADESVQCLATDADGTLWVGTARGLSRYRSGHFANVGVAEGLVSDVVCHIEDDGLGNLWISTHRGLQRIAKDDLNRCADGVIARIPRQIFDRADGLPTLDFTERLQAGGCRTSDGRLWFPSSKGLVAVTPTKIQHNPLPPPVVIESMLVDGQMQRVGGVAGASPKLAPDHHRIEFRFAGLSFTAPDKVAFKYRLDGIDREWVDAGTKRTAFYSRLPAGRYRLRVVASNNDGVWSPEGATLAFTVEPFFWQTWWFVGSAVLAVLSIVALAARAVTRRRMQRQLEQLERQHAVERERARIAQDIHDDIGTSLTRIAMFSQPEGSELDEPQQTAATLARIYTTTREATRALDEIVWAIDPRQDTLDGLVGYMGRFAQEMLDAAGIRCRLHLPVDLPSWPLRAEIRHNLFLAFKEALNNTVKHAGATEVRIALELRVHAFVLGIHDNGRGFDRREPGPRAPGRIGSGRGLAHLEHRLARIGGRCEIVSAPGEGTTVSFIVPIREEAASAAPPPQPSSSP